LNVQIDDPEEPIQIRARHAHLVYKKMLKCSQDTPKLAFEPEPEEIVHNETNGNIFTASDSDGSGCQSNCHVHGNNPIQLLCPREQQDPNVVFIVCSMVYYLY